jgi:hypothetical protein
VPTWQTASASSSMQPCRCAAAMRSDGRESRFFYWDDVPGRRMRPEKLTSAAALEQVKAFARAERDKDGDET